MTLEKLMDHLRMPTKRKTEKGKYHELKLHDRLLLFQESDPKQGNRLLAVKWLGNTGSHEEQVSAEDLLDAYEVLEHALAEILDKTSSRVDALAKKLTKKHAGKKKSGHISPRKT